MAKRRQRKLIGTAPELLLADGGRIVFGPGAKMFGMPDGSLQIVGPRRRVEGARHLAPGEVLWDNPPGPMQGVTLGSRVGAIRIDPNGVVTPTQASRLIKKSTVWVYRLIKTGKLRPINRRGKEATLIPLSEIKRLLGSNRAGGPWLVG